MTCDRITIINSGRIVATDTPENLTARLAGQLGYAIEVAGDPGQALAVLSQLPQVEAVTPLAADGLADNHHRFQVMAATDEDPGSAIATTIINADLGLYELSRNRVSLEDVFINLTTEEPVAASLDVPDDVPASHKDSEAAEAISPPADVTTASASPASDTAVSDTALPETPSDSESDE